MSASVTALVTLGRAVQPGLGLAIAKHTAQRHGGEMQVESEPGKGSTFRLVFPPARVQQRSAEAAEPLSAETRR